MSRATDAAWTTIDDRTSRRSEPISNVTLLEAAGAGRGDAVIESLRLIRGSGCGVLLLAATVCGDEEFSLAATVEGTFRERWSLASAWAGVFPGRAGGHKIVTRARVSPLGTHVIAAAAGDEAGVIALVDLVSAEYRAGAVVAHLCRRPARRQRGWRYRLQLVVDAPTGGFDAIVRRGLARWGREASRRCMVLPLAGRRGRTPGFGGREAST